MFQPTTVSPLKAAASSMALPRRRWLLAAGSGLLIALLVGGGYWLSRGPETTGQLTQTVALGEIEDAVSALGTLQPLQYVDVGTQVSGQLKVLHVNYGDMVREGQLLAEIDPALYEARANADEAQLLNLKAQVAQRRAELDLARQQYDRQKELLAANATSKDSYDTAQSKMQVSMAQIDALEAQIKQTESTLRGDRANLGYTKIYAPMAGTVVNLNAKQGQMLNANQTAPIVLRIAEMETMTVWAQVSEADVPKLTIGMPAYFTTLGRSDKRWYGKLRQIIPTPEVINNVVLYDCLFDVENPDHDLLPQMSAQVYFVVADAKDAPLVPAAALHGGRGKPYTVHVIENGEMVTKPIEISVANRMQAAVKSGVKAGDVVVLDGAPVLPEGKLPGGISRRGR